jgi:hypothetical protein
VRATLPDDVLRAMALQVQTRRATYIFEGFAAILGET